MNIMMTARRPRSPRLEPWLPAEQAIAYKRELEYAFERTHGGKVADAWDDRVKEHVARLEGSSANTVFTDLHSCIHCQKMMIDVSQPIVFNRSGNAVYPKNLEFQCSLKEAREGAEGGCHLFEQLFSQWEPSELVEGEEQYYHVFAYGPVESDEDEFDLVGVSNIGLIDSRKGWTKWDNANSRDSKAPLASADVYTERDDPASAFVSGRPINVDPWSFKTIEMARSSLSNCLQCSEMTDIETVKLSNQQVPARLLAISKSNGGWSLRLEQVSVPTSKYCTLSYCWGQTQRGFTTSTNVQERYVHVEFSVISKTIQDAIIVSWDLGVRYLWVDALCIVQDDQTDKAVEISKMSYIYANAYLTICTSRSLFADEGFLMPRIPLLADAPVFRLPYRLPHQEGRGSVVLYKPDPYSADNRLVTRAWGYQERMLSRRILDFDGTATAFSCCHTKEDSTHSFRDGGPSRHCFAWKSIDWHRRRFAAFDDIQARTDDRMAFDDVNYLWSDIVRGYTERNVTNPTDRVLAIAAIAERFALYTKDEYIGGIWKRTLPWSLMWCMRTRKVRPPRPEKTQTTYQGPSWSWLAISGPVHFFHAKELLREGARVSVGYVAHEVDLQYSAAPYGAVRSASIALKGRVRRARWIRNDNPREIEDYDFLAIHEMDQPHWSTRSEADLPGKKDGSAIPYTPEDLIPAKILPDALEPEFASPIGSGGSADLEVILLQMFRREGIPIGLVLRDPGGNNDGFYERLGLFYMVQGQHLQKAGDEKDALTDPEKAANNDEADEATVETKEEGDKQQGDSEEDLDEELLLLRWEYAEGTDGPNDTALLDDMKPYSARIGKGLENVIKEKKEYDLGVEEWEKWKHLFDDESWKPYFMNLGVDREKERVRRIEHKEQIDKEEKLWEKWKGWFDEGDNETQVLVLI